MAEGERFELSGLSSDGFQDRCIRPLCHPSQPVHPKYYSKELLTCRGHYQV